MPTSSIRSDHDASGTVRPPNNGTSLSLPFVRLLPEMQPLTKDLCTRLNGEGWKDWSGRACTLLVLFNAFRKKSPKRQYQRKRTIRRTPLSLSLPFFSSLYLQESLNIKILKKSCSFTFISPIKICRKSLLSSSISPIFSCSSLSNSWPTFRFRRKRVSEEFFFLGFLFYFILFLIY